MSAARIRSPRRLKRVHKALSKVGYALQYSVFALDLDDWERPRMAARLRRLVDEREDDVRLYLVPNAPIEVEPIAAAGPNL